MIELNYKIEPPFEDEKREYPYVVLLTNEILPLLKITLNNFENGISYYTNLTKGIFDDKNRAVLTKEEFNYLQNLINKYNSDLEFKEKFDNLIKE